LNTEPSNPGETMDLAGDMFHTFGLAAAAGIAAALISGFVVLMITLAAG